MEVLTRVHQYFGVLIIFAFPWTVRCQGGGGVAVGLGLGADLMMDTALGEMPNPLFLMGSNQNTGAGVTNSPLGAGGGFDSGGLFSLFGPDPGLHSGPFLSGHLDLSNNAGLLDPSHGAIFFSDAINLPSLDHLSNNRFHANLPSAVLSGQSQEPFIMQNEAFTALGNIGQAHMVRTSDMTTKAPPPSPSPAHILSGQPSASSLSTIASNSRVENIEALRQALVRSLLTSIGSDKSERKAIDFEASRRANKKSSHVSSAVTDLDSLRKINDTESLRRALIHAVMHTGRVMGSGDATITSKQRFPQRESEKERSESRPVPISLERITGLLPREHSTTTPAPTPAPQRNVMVVPSTQKSNRVAPIPHLEDLTANGIYPFEGSFAAKDALLSQSTAVINDINKAIQASAKGSETLHLENPVLDSVVFSGSNGAPITNFEGVRIQKPPGHHGDLMRFPSPRATSAPGTKRTTNIVTSTTSPIVARSTTQKVISDADFVLYQSFKDTNVANGGGLAIGHGAQYIQPVSKQTGVNVATSNSLLHANLNNSPNRNVPISRNDKPVSKTTAGSFGNDRFGIHLKPEWLSRDIRGFSVMPNTNSPGISAQISDFSKVVDLTRGSSLGSQINQVDETSSVPVSSRDSSRKSFVGTLFGDSLQSQSDVSVLDINRPTPSVDFMSTFLNHAGSQSKLNMVPLDQKAVAEINLAQDKAKANDAVVGQFGVADVYPREQKLDPAQWKRFLSSISQNDTSPRFQTVVDYQTQNVVGAGETRALNADTGNINSIESQLNKLVILQQAQQEMLGQRRLSNEAMSDPSSIRTTFEAPGMGRQGPASFARSPNTMDTRPNDGTIVDLGTQTMTNRNNQEATAPVDTGFGRHSIGKSIMVQDGGSPLTALTSTSLNKLASNGLRLGQPIMVSESNVNDLLSGRTSVNSLIRDSNFGPGAGIKVSDLLNARDNTGRLGTGISTDSRQAVFGSAGSITNTMTSRGLAADSSSLAGSSSSGPLRPTECRYMADPTSTNHFYMLAANQKYRLRCALGTAFDSATCECSTRVVVTGDCLEVHMDFNNGVVEDSSMNKLPIGNENVEVTNKSTPLTGIALFGGDGKLTIWRYQNYDFRDQVMIKVQFRPGPGGDRFQPLLSNCDGGISGPSIGIIYDRQTSEVKLQLKTDNDTHKELTFSVNPDEWNDVTYIYDGQEFIGIVNGVRRYVSRQDPHLLGIIGGEIKSLPTQGLIEIRDAAIILGHCPRYGNFRGAMVDIQIYTCIPKDFRLE